MGELPSSAHATIEYFATFFQGQLSIAEIRSILVQESPNRVFPCLLSLCRKPTIMPVVSSQELTEIPQPIPEKSRSGDTSCNRFSVDLHGFTREYAALYLRRALMSWAIKNNYEWTFIHGKGIHAGGIARLPMLTRNICRAHGIEFEVGKNEGQTMAVAKANLREASWIFASHVRWNLRGVLEKQEAPIKEKSAQGRMWITIRKSAGEEKGANESEKQICEPVPRGQAI
jgi:hypothetical protein